MSDRAMMSEALQAFMYTANSKDMGTLDRWLGAAVETNT